MTPYAVIVTPEAEEQLVALYRYIAGKTSPQIAARYSAAILSHCLQMDIFPLRGTSRDDIRPGLRITHYQGRVAIAFTVNQAAFLVSIIGIFYGGQDYETALSP